MGCCNGGESEVEGQDDGAELDEVLHAGDESSRVELGFRCKGVSCPGGGGPTSTHIVAYIQTEGDDGEGSERELLGKTESKPRTRYPVWARSVHATYEFQHSQLVTVELVDDSRREPQVLGTASVKLKQLIEDSPLHVQLTKEVQNRRGDTRTHNAGRLTITAEEYGKHQGPIYEVIMEVGCHSLDSKNVFGGASDPFLVVSRIVDGQFKVVYKTEHITGVVSCEWKPIVIKLDKLCKCDFNCWLLFEVWDYEKSSQHQLIGYTRQTLAWLRARLEPDIDLQNDSCRGKVTTKFRQTPGAKKSWLPLMSKVPYERSGVLNIKSICIDTSHSFLEYVKAGFEINLTVCVDFSSSNGALDDPSSLHYVAPSGVKASNEYTRALERVVGVLGEYDKDKDFTFWGFGAIPKSSAQSPGQAAKEGGGLLGLTGAAKKKEEEEVSHIFPVSGDYLHPNVPGVEGLMDAYWECITNRITPAEPTQMTPCLSQTFKHVVGRTDAYQIVLFVTDGQCDDFQSLVDLVVDASEEAISIIIIGVGPGPFSKMERLSADDEPLQSSDKRTMRRDIVGFVPFRTYQNSLTELRREILKEVPGQFTSWAKVHKIKPGKQTADSGNQGGAAREPLSPMVSMGMMDITQADMTHMPQEEEPLSAPAPELQPPPERKAPRPVRQAPALVLREPTPQDTGTSFSRSDGSDTDADECEWDSFSDDATGHRYYHNARTQASVWHEPPAYTEWKARRRPAAVRRTDTGQLRTQVEEAQRVASVRAAALAAERHRAEEAEATAAYLASEAARLRRQNRELQQQQDDLPHGMRGYPFSSAARPTPTSPAAPLVGPSLPKSQTQRQTVSPDHCGSRSNSPEAPYHALTEAPASTRPPPRPVTSPPQATPGAMLQCEARQWASQRAPSSAFSPQRRS